MTTKPTRAEKNRIIINESKGIQHPLYYVHTTKAGLIQVRKRTTPLPSETAPKIISDEGTASSSLKGDEGGEKPQPKPQIDYETVTNKQLLEKMLQILEQNVVSRDRNLNSVENERVTAENEKFITEVERSENTVTSRPARRGRTL